MINWINRLNMSKQHDKVSEITFNIIHEVRVIIKANNVFRVSFTPDLGDIKKRKQKTKNTSVKTRKTNSQLTL